MVPACAVDSCCWVTTNVFCDCGGMSLMGCLEWEWHGVLSPKGLNCLGLFRLPGFTAAPWSLSVFVWSGKAWSRFISSEKMLFRMIVGSFKAEGISWRWHWGGGPTHLKILLILVMSSDYHQQCALWSGCAGMGIRMCKIECAKMHIMAHSRIYLLFITLIWNSCFFCSVWDL